MDRFESSKNVGRAGRDNLLPQRVAKQSNYNELQVVIEAKDIYSTIPRPNNMKGPEHSSIRQRQDLQVRKSSMPTSKEVNDRFSHNLFVRRLSQSGVSPGSQEFQSVLRGFLPPKEDEGVKLRSQTCRAKHRKISFNEYGRASQAMTLSPRPKRSLDMLNAPTISSINRAVDHRKHENNEKTTQSQRSFPFFSIKEAWQQSESSLQASKVERRRHVSLPAPPPRFYLDNRQETLVEPFKGEKVHRKETSEDCSRSKRKISTVACPNLHEMKSVNNAIGSPWTTGSETNVPKVSPEIGDLTGFTAQVKSPPENVESQQRKISPTLNTELSKIKQISTANGQDLHPNLLLGIKSKQEGNGKMLDEFGLNGSGEQAALRARKNFQRIGKAAVAARRFLGIHHREAVGSTKPMQQRAISPLAKSEKPFDQMVEEMKYSYQGLQLGPKTEEENPNST